VSTTGSASSGGCLVFGQTRAVWRLQQSGRRANAGSVRCRVLAQRTLMCSALRHHFEIACVVSKRRPPGSDPTRHWCQVCRGTNCWGTAARDLHRKSCGCGSWRCECWTPRSFSAVHPRCRAPGRRDEISQEEPHQRAKYRSGQRLGSMAAAAVFGVGTWAEGLSWTWRKLSFPGWALVVC
jgi:hypothetical protein